MLRNLNSCTVCRQNNCGIPEEDVKIRKYISYRLPNAGISNGKSIGHQKVSVTIYNKTWYCYWSGGEEVNKLRKIEATHK